MSAPRQRQVRRGLQPEDIELIEELLEVHRTVMQRDPFAVREQYHVQCAACDGSHWQAWRPGEQPYSCPLWTRGSDLLERLKERTNGGRQPR